MPQPIFKTLSILLMLVPVKSLSTVQAASDNAEPVAEAAENRGRYFVCTDAGGAKSFQEQPCAAGKRSEIRHYDKAPAVNAAPRLTTSNPAYQDLRNSNRQLELQRHIRQGEYNLRTIELRRNSELKALRSKKQQANNNLAGAVWEQSISAEMQAVNARYDAMLRTEQQQLDQLRNELASLRPVAQ